MPTSRMRWTLPSTEIGRPLLMVFAALARAAGR